MSDNGRWERFEPRSGDIVISTPSKCGTTWMQHIVTMLVLGSTELDRPIGALSPWLDARTHTDVEVFDLLAAQTHRRTIKTHTPLDGLPHLADVSFIAMARHPLDVALSFRDHQNNVDYSRVRAMIVEANGFPDIPPREQPPKDRAEYLGWWIDNDIEPDGAGPYGLDDFCNSIRATWHVRSNANVCLVHYSDLCRRPQVVITRIAEFLDVDVSPEFTAAIVDATTFDRMRSDAENAAPFGDTPFWTNPADFFRIGGSRRWADQMDSVVLDRFVERMEPLDPDQREWALRGSAEDLR